MDNNYTPLHASYGKKKDGLLTRYIKNIDALLEQGIKGMVIELREAGYMGSSSTIRHYITDWKRRLKHFYDKSNESNTETLRRSDVLKLLYNPIEKVKYISLIQFENLCCASHAFELIYNIVHDFKNVLACKKC